MTETNKARYLTSFDMTGTIGMTGKKEITVVFSVFHESQNKFVFFLLHFLYVQGAAEFRYLTALFLHA